MVCVVAFVNCARVVEPAPWLGSELKSARVASLLWKGELKETSIVTLGRKKEELGHYSISAYCVKRKD